MATRPARASVTLRRGRDRRFLGVCSGLAEAGGVDPWLVRIGFLLLTTAGGVGVPLYFALAIVLPDSDAPPDATLRWNILAADARQPIGVALMVGGTLLLVRNLGAPISMGLVWGLALGLGCAALGLFRATSTTKPDGVTSDVAMPGFVPGRETLLRFVVGAVLVAAGVITLVATGGGFDVLRQVVIGALITVGGLGLILFPWVRGLLADLNEERRERIRSEERADMAAHLHDSVLQTLALIQRNADRPKELIALARRQERELRTWLYSERSGGVLAGTLGAALTHMAEEVEGSHGIEVDVVVVGDCPLDAHVDALIHATREAIVNAAKHAEVGVVSVYSEVADGRVEVFVRDRGVGFDPASVPEDRRGISDSIEARMGRHGGSAVVSSEPGDGTEVALTLPLTERVASA
jgi:phage shock protein PspC (stress-responsive transcriptional regulator)